MHDVECWITAACEEVLQKVEEMSGNFRVAGQWSLSLRETWWDGVKEDIWRGRVNGNWLTAKGDSRGRIACCVRDVTSV